MVTKRPSRTNRRQFIKVVGATGTVGASSLLAGCAGGEDPTDTGTASPTDTVANPQDSTETATEDPSNIETGGEVTVAAVSAADTLQIHKLADTLGANIGFNVSNTLVDTTPNGEIVPDLAAEMPTISDDGKTYTFPLREGVMFHPPYDREMTSEDVVWNFQKILDADYGGWGRTHFTGVLVGEDSDGNSIDPQESVVATGEYEVTFNLAEPYAPFLYKLARYVNGIIPPKSLEDHGDQLGTPSVGTWGTGPFIYDGGTPGESHTLVRNPDYFKESDTGQLPYLDKVHFQIVPQASVRSTGLQTGDFDIDESVSPNNVNDIESNEGIRVESKASTTKISNWVNTRNFEPTTKKRVRKALAYGMNENAIVQTKFKGEATPAWSPFPVWHWAYNKDACVTYEHDPEEAKSLLEEAGESGFTFNCSPENTPTYVDVATIMQQNYQQIGVEMEVTPKSYAAAWDPLEGGWGDTSIPPESWHSMVGAYTWGFPADDYSYGTFHTGGWNYSYYSDEEVDQWTEEARRLTDREKRRELYDKVQQKVTDDMPKIFVAWPNFIMGVNTSVRGLPVYPNATFVFESVWKEQ